MTRKRQYKSGSIRAEKNGRFSIRYYDADGKQREEAAGKDFRAAEKLLRQRVGGIAAGAGTRKAGADVTVKDCLDLAVADMRQRQLASARIAAWKVGSTLGEALGWMKAASFDWNDAWKYIESRRKDGVRNSTINRELSLLRSSLMLAANPPHNLIPSATKIPTLDEGDNVRTGFLSPVEYARMRDALPEEIGALFCVAYYTGLRRGTLLSIRLTQVDLDANLIWVSRVQTKNRKAQVAPIIDGEMRAFCVKALLTNKQFLFERAGRPIVCFKEAWRIARVEANLPNLNFHDLRRTAVRDWIAAGANEGEAMAISGHKTSSMLQRYNIIEAANIQKVAKLRQPQPEVQPEKLRGKQGVKPGVKPS